ncbi:MAG: hypothetical protein H0T79_08845 [Deltaproteobacteria bacterium]|nr:hypothetical protein [Deltaproteobacteria bacterium]
MTPASKLAALVDRCEADATAVADARPDGDALASEVGGELELRWWVAVIRGVMREPPDGDAVRELYGELVDRYRERPELVTVLRPLGDEIRALEASGALPSTLVARSTRPPRR